jgi:hypothetical protein
LKSSAQLLALKERFNNGRFYIMYLLGIEYNSQSGKRYFSLTLRGKRNVTLMAWP